MSNLPEQVHQHGTAMAVAAPDNPYAIDQSMITLPQLLFGQYQSTAFKSRLVEYGDIFVGLSAADPTPVVVAKGAEPLSAPVRFYVHGVRAAFDDVNPANKQDRHTIRGASTFQEALAQVGDPRRIWQKFVYNITVPAYEDLPVVFWAGGLSAKSARWVNTQIGLIQRRADGPAAATANILETAFQVQTRQTKNDNGDFVVAEFGFAKVAAKDAKADAVLVESHAPLANRGAATEDLERDAAPYVVAADAPDLG